MTRAHLKGFTPEQREQIRADVSKMRQFMNRLFAGGPEVFGAAGGSASQTFAWGRDHEIALNVIVRCITAPVPIGEGMEYETPGDVVRAAKKVRVEKEIVVTQQPKEQSKELPKEMPKELLKKLPKELPKEEGDTDIESEAYDSSDSENQMPPPDIKPKPKRLRKVEDGEDQEQAMWDRLSKRLDMEDRQRLREERMMERLRKSRQVRAPLPGFMEPAPALASAPVVGAVSDLESLPPVHGPSPTYHQPGYMPPESYAKRVQKREYPHVPHPDEYSQPYSHPTQPMPPPSPQPAITAPPVYNDPRVLQSYNSAGGVVMRLKTV